VSQGKFDSPQLRDKGTGSSNDFVPFTSAFGAIDCRQYNLIQPSLPIPPVWQISPQHRIESRVMMQEFQVAEFVNDDVIDAPHRSFDQIRVEQNSSSFRTTAPPAFHTAKVRLGDLNAGGSQSLAT
jgi:hypothetical protein